MVVTDVKVINNEYSFETLSAKGSTIIMELYIYNNQV